MARPKWTTHFVRIQSARLAAKSLVLLVLTACPFLLCAQDKQGISAYLETHGSVPPIPEWFSCVREFNDKAYDKRKAQVCLESIRRHPGILKARFSLKRGKSGKFLIFRVGSPVLNVNDVDWGLSFGDLGRFHEFIDINGNVLTTGEGFDSSREASSWNVLDLLFRAEGRRTGVSRTVWFDYRKKTARVAFKIWDGPRDVPQPLLPPYSEPCKIINGYFNLMDVDDLTPVDFVERQLKTKWCGCFSEADVRDDRAMLKSMTFLKEAEMSISGSGEQRAIDFRLRGNPIPVRRVVVHGYGLLGLSERELPALTIHPGDTYSRSASANFAASLRKWFTKPGRQVDVFVDVLVDAAPSAVLDFGVLAYPDDVVYIDGTRFDGTQHAGGE